MNLAILIGNLGADPEITEYTDKKTGEIKKIAAFTIATNKRWKDANGNKQERALWHNVVVYSDGLARIVNQYVHKGDKICVKGEIRTEEYTDEKTGAKRWFTKIAVAGFEHTIELLGGGTGGGGSSRQQPPPPSPNDFDDEIPF